MSIYRILYTEIQNTRGRPQSITLPRPRDSQLDSLDTELAQQSIELIASHEENRRKLNTQDGRTLRRYRKRWNIERFLE